MNAVRAAKQRMEPTELIVAQDEASRVKQSVFLQKLEVKPSWQLIRTSLDGC